MNDQDRATMENMEKNVGRSCYFNFEDGTEICGIIGGVPNTEHYTVVVPRNGYDWDWYVRSECIHIQK